MNFFAPGIADMNRQQIGLGEIAVVVGFFLGAHGITVQDSDWFQRRVSWEMRPPDSSTPMWRSISNSRAF